MRQLQRKYFRKMVDCILKDKKIKQKLFFITERKLGYIFFLCNHKKIQWNIKFFNKIQLQKCQKYGKIPKHSCSLLSFQYRSAFCIACSQQRVFFIWGLGGFCFKNNFFYGSHYLRQYSWFGNKISKAFNDRIIMLCIYSFVLCKFQAQIEK